MQILAFETSAKAASVALVQDGKLLGESYQNTGMTHSQTLMVMVEDLLHQCGATVSQLDGVAVSNGPGSFTGIRIGVAAAKGFAWGAELPCIGVSTLAAMAVGRMAGLCMPGDGCPQKPGLQCAVPCGLWKVHKNPGRSGDFPPGFAGGCKKFGRTDISGWRRQCFML